MITSRILRNLTEYTEKVCNLESNLFYIYMFHWKSQYSRSYHENEFFEIPKMLNPGEVIDVILCKGERGFGFTIVGGDDPGEMIQINAIVATGNDNRTGKHQW